MNSGKNRIKYMLLLTFAALSLGSFSCSENSDNPEDKEAQLMSLSDIRNSTGYAWFDLEYNAYTPDTAVISNIKTAYSGTGQEFLIFVNPSCACVGTQKRFPAIVRVLTDAGISEDKFKIYSMLVYNAPHPYKSAFTMERLPTLMVMNNGAAKYSVLDSLDFHHAYYPSDSVTIEQFILKGIQ